ncbi:MAG TPA: DUF58 domain-containing protein [Candidatus Limnocylindrales bacterium]|nr:DUF58 domain-containing protein [Candidatus Limnocylindrales bacterium]
MSASEIIRRVREIQVRTGRHVADVLAGEYVSVFKGGGVEFEEVRPYVPGDDVRSIDWNVTARTGEPFVKRYIEERQLTLLLMADVSASQDFGSGTRSKREAAAEFCALLAFSAIKNDDKVGLILFHGGVEQYIPPRKGQKHALRVVREVLTDEEENRGQTLISGNPGQTPISADGSSRTSPPASTPRAMNTGLTDGARRRAQAPGVLARARESFSRILPARRTMRRAHEATDISRAVRFAMSVTKRRAVCFVVSDFLDENFERALMTANQKHDVIAVLVTDRRELEIPAAGLIAMRDAETGRTMLEDTGSPAVRRAAEAAAAERIASLKRRLQRSGIDFIHIEATGSIVDPIVRFFRMRERRKRR